MNTYEPTELAKQFVTYLDCPCSVFEPMKNGEPVFKAYEDAVQRGKKEGFIPVLIQVDVTLGDMLIINAMGTDTLDFDMSVVRQYRKKLLETVLKPGRDCLKQRLEEYKEDWEEENNQTLMGSMEGGYSIDKFTGFWDLKAEQWNEVILAEIPVKNPWEVFAYVPMGGWNECPDEIEMMSVAKYWYECYGAIPVVITYDTLEFKVESPIEEKEKAKNLAMEQYAFCMDRVDQCEEDGSILKLADTLMKSTVWYFWWD